ncbi:MAG: hypothetical protein QXV75_08610, partial [Candidatus Bathyarchaeia archaeon]
IPPDKVNEAIMALKSLNVEANVVGRVKEYNGHFVEVMRGSSVTYVDEIYVMDEIYRFWEDKGMFYHYPINPLQNWWQVFHYNHLKV